MIRSRVTLKNAAWTKIDWLLMAKAIRQEFSTLTLRTDIFNLTHELWCFRAPSRCQHHHHWMTRPVHAEVVLLTTFSGLSASTHASRSRTKSDGF
ncbi:MAG TPA: hypothetical protein DC054_01655 [Blastocatellia bacterium]|nr:hypothetical protein [Blastocatellia bacterium]